MKYLLILVVMALAVAPLLHFVPSPKQRRISAMRERAALGGLFVEFRDLPVVGNSAQLPQPPKGSVIYYARRLPPPRGKTERRAIWLKRGEAWQGSQLGAELPAELEDIADIAMAVSLENGSCGVYWQEQGDEEDVERIVAAVGRWGDSQAQA